MADSSTSLRRRGTTSAAESSDKPRSAASGRAVAAKVRSAPTNETATAAVAAATTDGDASSSDEEDLSGASDGVRMMRTAVDAEIARVESQPDATLWEALKDPTFRYNLYRELLRAAILFGIVIAFHWWMDSRQNNSVQGPSHEELVARFQQRVARGFGSGSGSGGGGTGL